MKILLIILALGTLVSCGHRYQPPGQDLWRML